MAVLQLWGEGIRPDNEEEEGHAGGARRPQDAQPSLCEAVVGVKHFVVSMLAEPGHTDSAQRVLFTSMRGNRAVSEPFRPSVAGVRTVTEIVKGARPLRTAHPFAYAPLLRASPSSGQADEAAQCY